MNVHITGTGHAVPENILTNDDLSRIVDTNDEWITTRTGIKQRHIAEPHQKNSDFASAACLQAMADANCAPEEIDFIFMGTVTGDLIFPSTACRVQENIGAVNATAMDLSAACAGWIFGISVATACLRMGQGRKALVVGSEVLSRMMNWEDRSTCVLFGDGAGAVVLEVKDEEGGVLGIATHTDGRRIEMLNCPKGGTADPVTPEILAAKENKIHMKGNDVFKYAVRSMAGACREVLDQAQLTLDDIDLFIPHQANTRIISALASRLNVSEDKLLVNIQEYGNTSAASVPIGLNEARRSGRIKPGDHVLVAAFGGGFAWGAALFRF
ncbi:MAG: ketoacyl-ACP synthase III [bacterium]|nr:ketoacyl-ACP synthase III [bacterium]